MGPDRTRSPIFQRSTLLVRPLCPFFLCTSLCSSRTMLINVVVRSLLPVPDQRYASQWNPRNSISSPVILLPPRSRRSHHRVVTRKEIPEFVFELCQVRIQSPFSSTPSLHSIPLVRKKLTSIRFTNFFPFPLFVSPPPSDPS